MLVRRSSLSVLLVLAVACGDDGGTGSGGSTADDSSSTSTAPSTTATSSTTVVETDTTDSASSSSSGVDTDATGSTGTTGGDEVAELWTFTHNGADSEEDEARGVAVDGEGNVYAAGLETSGGAPHVWAIRLDPGGREVWTHTGSVPGNANAIALLPGGDVAIAGSIAVGAQLDITVIRLAGDTGNAVWNEDYDGATAGDDDALGIAVDGAGDIVVVGQEAGVAGTDAWIRKYDPDGGEQWTTMHVGDAAVDDAALGVAIDGADNVVVVGYVDAGTTDADGFVARYDSGGVEDWFVPIAIDVFQVMRGVAVDADDNVIVSGRVGEDVLSIFVGKYDSGGAELWTAMHLESNGPDYGRSVAVDGSGNAYVAGFVNNPGHFLDLWGRKYTGAGDELWSISYRNEEAGLDDVANAIAVDGDGNVIVAGLETVFLESRNVWIRKYSQ